MEEKIIKLIGEENLNKIKKAKILLVGIGGVGSFAYECLIRSGFLDITIIDNDKVNISNINRQLIADLSTLNEYKVDIARSKAANINHDIKLTIHNIFLDKNSLNLLETDYDYIIDACDTLQTKLELIRFAEQHNIKIISAMGLGNRIDASMVKISTLNKTYQDPLAKKLRKLVKENNLKSNIPVVFSTELPIKKGEVNSLITSPSVAGILMVNYIINDIIKL